MRMTLKIAANELRKLFYSPIAWILAVLMMVITAYFFISSFFDVHLKDLALYNTTRVPYFFTREFIADSSGVINSMARHLYLFVPLLTMGIVSREYSSGSIKLLFSSSASNGQIIFGKYAGVAVYFLIVMLLAFTPVAVVSAMGIQSIDLPLLLTSFLSLVLMVWTYVAVGIFLSSLTSYQIVAALVSILVLNLLNSGVSIRSDNDLVRTITYWITVPRHSMRMQMGLVVSEDVVYYVLMSLMFLGFAVKRLNYKRRRSPIYRRILGYLSIVAVCLTVGYLTFLPRFTLYCDVTQTKYNTLSQTSREIVSHLDDNLKITAYANVLDPYFYMMSKDSYQGVYESFERYFRFLPHTQLEFVYFYDSIPGLKDMFHESRAAEFEGMTTEQMAMAMTEKFDFPRSRTLLTPQQVHARIDMSGHNGMSVFAVENTATGQTQVFGTFDDQTFYPSEMEISTALKLFYRPAVKVAALVGHDERSIHREREVDFNTATTYKRFRQSLVNQGFVFDTISLAGGGEIPDDVDILMIADARTRLSQQETERIQRFVDRGGNLFLTVRPGREANVAQLLDPLGIRFTEGLLVQEHMILLEPDIPFGFLNERVADSLPRSTFGSANTLYAHRASGIKYSEDSGFRIYPFVRSAAKDVWVELETDDFSRGNMLMYNKEAGEYYVDSIPMLVGLERTVGGRNQRIMVSSTTDAFSNVQLRMERPSGYPQPMNFPLLQSIFTWLADGEYIIEPFIRVGPDNAYTLAIEDRTWANPLLQFILPGIVLLIGIFVIMKRKGK